MLFRGKSQRSLDVKGRLMLPPEYRDAIVARDAQGRFVLTCYDGCLVGFPLPDWEAFEGSLLTLTNASRKLRDFRRLVIGSAEELALDKQGRVLLSPAHRAYAGLDGAVELVGQLQKFEIWSPAQFTSLIEGQNYDDVTQELEAGGIAIPL